MKKLLIFDLDGTLLDTLGDLQNSVNFALSKKNYPLRSLEQIRLAIGNGVSKLVERSIPNGANNPDYIETLEGFKHHYSENYKAITKPYDGVIETLKTLKNNYLLAVCTNKVQDVAEELIHLFFGDIFDFIQGDMELVNKKPAPDMINRTVKSLGISKTDCLYIGDTEVDEQTAKNSQVEYVLVSYGYRTLDELKIKTPNARIVNDQKELIHFIKKQD